MKRLFAAIDVSETVVDAIRDLQQAFQEHLDGSMRVRWTPAENLHVTLKFLGATEVDLVEPVSERLSAHAAEVEPFEMEIAGLGAFPRPDRPRVLWADVDAASAETLFDLHGAFQEDLEERFDIDRDEHPYKAHLTYGRVKSSKAPNLARLEDDLPGGSFGTTQVDEVVLYESERTPSGAEYSVIHRAPLGG